MRLSCKLSYTSLHMKLMLECPNCLSVFDSGYSFGGTVTLYDNASRCRTCRTWVGLPDGVFRFMADRVLEYVYESADPGQTAKEIKRELSQGEGPHLQWLKNNIPFILELGMSLLLFILGQILQQPTTRINQQTIINNYYQQEQSSRRSDN